jgi:hypothetical protein
VKIGIGIIGCGLIGNKRARALGSFFNLVACMMLSRNAQIVWQKIIMHVPAPRSLCFSAIQQFRL